MTATPELADLAADVQQRLAPVDEDAAATLAAGLQAADPYPATRETLEAVGRTASVPVAVGKAAVPMARAWSDWGGPPGVVVGPEGIEPDLEGWEVRWGEHPVPGARSYAAGQRVVDLVRQGLPVVLLLSGGASSLMESPTVGEEAHRALSRDLVRAGLPIDELNAARSLISELKAGGLAGEAERAGQPLTVLYVSDVPDDDPAIVGSGPGTARPPGELVAALDGLPDDLRERVLDAAADGDVPRADADHHLVLPRRAPVEAAVDAARDRGVEPAERCLDGPVDDTADRVADAADGFALLWGEPHLAVPDDAGTGGRATHLVVEAARRVDDPTLVAAVATDGDDGRDGAGGYVRAPCRDAEAAVSAYDTATYLDGLDDGGAFPGTRTHANSADLGVVADLG